MLQSISVERSYLLGNPCFPALVQTRLSHTKNIISLGIYANSESLEKAEAEAKRLGRPLAMDKLVLLNESMNFAGTGTSQNLR